ncbi:MAG: acyl-CoA thioesterase [Candidatus Obscuribacterales bacterium]|nr:acyl-CoA thioesterase [Steroidobacteraceae bacterium]
MNPTRSDFKVLRPIQTRWLDNDHYGHVNNVMYYAYFDTAVNGWLMEATGVDTRQLDAIGLVAETSCRFLQAVSFPERLYVGLRLQKLGNSSVVYDIAMFREVESDPVAVAKFVHVYVNAQTRKSVPIPPLIRAALSALQ